MGKEPNWTDAVITEYWVVAAMVNKSFTGHKFNGISDFKGERIGTMHGYKYPEELGNFKDLKVEEVPDAILNLKKLNSGCIEVTFDDIIWAELENKKNKLDKLKYLMPLVSSSPTNLIISPKSKDFATLYTQKAQELIKAGELEKLYEKYTESNLKTFKTKYDIK